MVSAAPVNEFRHGIRRHPLLELLPVAVGGKNQMVTMNVFSARCASVLGATTPREDLTIQPVEMITLAELRRRTHAQRDDLLKLDIEGAEIDLFYACSDEELQSVMQITVEFHDFLYPELQSPVTQIRRRMRDIGFWVLPFSLDNTNVLFVNKKRLLALPNSHICEPLLNTERVCSVVYDLEPGKQETSHADLGEITESLKAVTCSLSEL